MSAAEAFPKIDAHVHVRGDKAAAAAVLALTGVRAAVNINYLSDEGEDALLGFEAALNQGAADHATRFLTCTTFSVDTIDDPSFCERSIARLEARLRGGAIAVKIWKNLGMSSRDASGRLVQCDDPRLDLVFDWLRAREIVVYLHTADPIEAWLPLDETGPHRRYYTNHPEFHLHGKSGAPSHGELLAARDRLLRRWPTLRFVAAHLASVSHDVEAVGAFLDTHANAVVDVSARQADLMRQDDAKVRALFLRHPERILYGTDWSLDGARADVGGEDWIAQAHRAFEHDLTYFTDRLALPEEVLRYFFHDNALRWLRLDRLADCPLARP